MSCLGRAAVPVKRVWRGLSARLGLRRATGLGRLRKEVRTCEYRDVHVMWEMLSSTGSTRAGGATPDVAAGKASRRTRRRRKPVAWSRLVSYCCAL
ncbi:uncharacterized protein LOC133893425 [Phragmites australis]|uniref:uncharacterized protein LOC133893425 n=1 Tax=Phragmites australis TaxID=29695 RepID=UPI002D778DBA|nr:uncharacterized protein LOC133893425 [Phragmites australis]